jgi:hypothetical protein
MPSIFSCLSTPPDGEHRRSRGPIFHQKANWIPFFFCHKKGISHVSFTCHDSLPITSHTMFPDLSTCLSFFLILLRMLCHLCVQWRQCYYADPSDQKPNIGSHHLSHIPLDYCLVHDGIGFIKMFFN